MAYTKVATIRETLKRARESNLGISENFLRQACREGKLKHNNVGSKILIYWPNLISYLQNGDTVPASETEIGKIRKISV